MADVISTQPPIPDANKRGRTNGRVIRFERGAQVYFLTSKGESTVLAEARVFRQDAAAERHRARAFREGLGRFCTAINARLDDDGRAAWVHPQWLKTEQQEREEKAAREQNSL